MKRTMSLLTLACIYIGTVIGAGFASGQEIIQFFSVHGKFSVLGILVSMVLFCFLGVKLLKITYVEKINSLEGLLSLYFRKRTIILINIWLIGFLFITYFIMLAGSGAIFKEYFQVNQIFGIIFMSLICFLVFITGVKGIAKANVLLIPLLLIIICLIGVYVLYNNNYYLIGLIENTEINIRLQGSRVLISFGSAILYVAFNSISTIVVFTSLRTLIADKKAAVYGGILGGIGLGIMALIINFSLLTLYKDIIGFEIPMIVVASSLGDFSRRIYSIILLVAMFTTAIANGYGCVQRIGNIFRVNEKIISLLICCVSIPMAALGFRRLVSFFYPVFGYIGVIFLLVLILKERRRNLKR